MELSGDLPLEPRLRIGVMSMHRRSEPAEGPWRPGIDELKELVTLQPAGCPLAPQIAHSLPPGISYHTHRNPSRRSGLVKHCLTFMQSSFPLDSKIARRCGEGAGKGKRWTMPLVCGLFTLVRL